MKKSFLYAVCLLTVLPSILSAQSNGADARHTMDKSPYAKFVGSWQAEVERPQGKTSATLDCRLDLDNQYFLFVYKESLPEGKTMEGWGAITHAKGEKYDGVWISNRGTNSTINAAFDGKSFKTVYTDTRNGAVVKQKGNWTTEDAFEISSRLTLPDGSVQTWQTSYKRKKPVTNKS